MRNIIFFGDSLTAGYGLADVKHESVPGLIQQKIDVEGLDYHVINGGLSGDTTSGGLARLDYWLNRPIDVFVLELGINDMMRQVPTDRIYHNLDAILLKVKAKYPGIKLALMGMKLPDLLSGMHINEFNALYPKLADKYDIAFLPFYLEGVAGQRNLNMIDGLHPSAAGYKIIAENVWKVIRPLLSL